MAPLIQPKPDGQSSGSGGWGYWVPLLLLAGIGSFLGRWLSARAAGEELTFPLLTLVLSLTFFAAIVWTVRHRTWSMRTRGLVVAAFIAAYIVQFILRSQM